MESRIGRDAHASSCTLGVVTPKGKWVGSHVVGTNARCLIEAVRQIPESRDICLEAGTLSEWLYEVLSPHAEKGVVAAVSESRGPKHDFDLWIQWWRSRHVGGEVIVVRYADDVVVGFQHRSDAIRFRKELDARMSEFGLELHPEKARLLGFGRYAAERRAERGMGKPETFDFLGLHYICGKTRAGDFLLARHTSRKRMAAKLLWVREELMRRRHLPIKEQGLWLQRVVGGYFNYHAIPTNVEALQQFRRQVTGHWRRALRRRSQKDRTDWERVTRPAERWLPKARVQRPWPNDRFDAKTRGGSPVR